METGKEAGRIHGRYMEEAGCRFDEKTEKHVDSSINSAGTLCMLVAVLWSMQLIWSDRKGSPTFAVP